ncbi:MAG: hypothetical protein LLF94_09500 [Chlamydiales bacterium]|nr:hypothetical protein [Chlamydiales bacterium]
MSKTFVLSDESVNSYGFWVLTSGIDLSQFLKNPLMLWMHNRAWRGTKDEVLPIGHWENIRIEGDRLLGDAVFDEKDVFAVSIRDKVEAGHIRMASVNLEPVLASNEKQYLKTGQTREALIKSKLYEASIVDIGGNDNALALCADPLLTDNGQTIFLSNPDQACPVKLLDTITYKNIEKMEKIALKLGLKSSATEAEILEAIDVQLEKSGRVESLSKKLSDIEKGRIEAEKAEAIQLVDAAILAGKIDSKAKTAQLSLFEKDFASAKLALESIPDRPDVQGNFGKGGKGEYADLEKLSFTDMDKKGLLGKVKSTYPDLYKLKFKEEYGSEPTNM